MSPHSRQVSPIKLRLTFQDRARAFEAREAITGARQLRNSKEMLLLRPSFATLSVSLEFQPSQRTELSGVPIALSVSSISSHPHYVFSAIKAAGTYNKTMIGRNGGKVLYSFDHSGMCSSSALLSFLKVTPVVFGFLSDFFQPCASTLDPP